MQFTPTWAKPGRELNKTQLSYFKQQGLKEPELNHGLEMSQDDTQDARSIGAILLFPQSNLCLLSNRRSAMSHQPIIERCDRAIRPLANQIC